MTYVSTVLAIILVLGGTFFMLVGSIGLIRFPDFYTRAHASGKVDTLGILMFLSGLAVFQGVSLNAAKLALIIVFVLLTSPVATHALARSALLFGLRPRYGAAKETTDNR
jgi:multicomponent Na+:H+ antiporter subunit G